VQSQSDEPGRDPDTSAWTQDVRKSDRRVEICSSATVETSSAPDGKVARWDIWHYGSQEAADKAIEPQPKSYAKGEGRLSKANERG
jgi:hypothetical protein